MESVRYEVKMSCAAIHAPQVRAWIWSHPDVFATTYPPRQVNSLYFDTHEMACLNDNLAGVSERTKLRFRWYGRNHSAVQGVLEVKHKANRLGWKDRCPVPVTFDLTAISWIDLMRQIRQHATGDAALWLSHADRPVLINGYMREYYESRDHQIRITLDYDQAVYEQITHFAPNLTTRSFGKDLIVVEIKADPKLHRRISDILSWFPLRTGRHSKYVEGLVDALGFL